MIIFRESDEVLDENEKPAETQVKVPKKHVWAKPQKKSSSNKKTKSKAQTKMQKAKEKAAAAAKAQAALPPQPNGVTKKPSKTVAQTDEDKSGICCIYFI